MPGQRQRDKELTRARISQVATALFVERGFDAVTVAEVAGAAGVSKVTVFAHFPRKEDLLLDLAPEAETVVTSAVRDRGPGVDPVQALRDLAFELARQRHALSGLLAGVEPFLQTVAASPALLARARELLAELENTLVDVLAADGTFVADPRLVSALVLAAYRTVVTESVVALLRGAAVDEVAADHTRRLGVAFDAVQAAVGSSVSSG